MKIPVRCCHLQHYTKPPQQPMLFDGSVSALAKSVGIGSLISVSIGSNRRKKKEGKGMRSSVCLFFFFSFLIDV